MDRDPVHGGNPVTYGNTCFPRRTVRVYVGHRSSPTSLHHRQSDPSLPGPPGSIRVSRNRRDIARIRVKVVEHFVEEAGDHALRAGLL